MLGRGMEYPKTYIQERDKYRVNENDRRSHSFLTRFFKAIKIYVGTTADYLLFNRSTNINNDKFQFDSSTSIISNSNSVTPTLKLVRSLGTESSPTVISDGTVLGEIDSYGYNGTTYYKGGSIYFYKNTGQGTGIAFLTTNYSGSAVEASGAIVPSGSWAAGKADLATNATTGFLYVPSCAGVPTGVPETIDSRVPIVVDRTNNRAYIYSGGSWVALN